MFSKKLFGLFLAAAALFLFGCLGSGGGLPEGFSQIEGKQSCSADLKPRIFFFTDPYCPACVSSEENVAAFVNKFGAQTEIVFKMLVTHSAGLMQNPDYGSERILAAHEYFLCAQEQKKLSEFKKAFYNNLKVSESITGRDFVPFTQDELKLLATQAGLNEPLLSKCLSSARQRITADSLDAETYGVKGTPSVIIDCRYLGHAARAENGLCYAFPNIEGCKK